MVEITKGIKHRRLRQIVSSERVFGNISHFIFNHSYVSIHKKVGFSYQIFSQEYSTLHLIHGKESWITKVPTYLSPENHLANRKHTKMEFENKINRLTYGKYFFIIQNS